MSTVVKDLGAVSAYAYAVEKGYTGTEAEFAELMADYAEVGQRAEDAAESALNSKTAAQTAATTATNKASEATTAAQTATTKAQEAVANAEAAARDASQAMAAESMATAKASEATTAAATATTAKDDAVSAKTAAETAQGKAEDAQAAAESVAESIPSDYSQLSEDVSDLKEELTALSESVTLTRPNAGSREVEFHVSAGEVVKVTNGATGCQVRLRATSGGTNLQIHNAPANTTAYFTATVDASYIGVYFNGASEITLEVGTLAGINSVADKALKTADNVFPMLILEQGGITMAGEYKDNANRLRTVNTLQGSFSCHCPKGFRVYYAYYFDANGYIVSYTSIGAQDAKVVVPSGTFCKLSFCKDNENTDITVGEIKASYVLEEFNDKLNAIEYPPMVAFDADYNLDTDVATIVADKGYAKGSTAMQNIYSYFDSLVDNSYVTKVDLASELGISYPRYANGVESGDATYLETPAYKTYMYKLICSNSYINTSYQKKRKVIILGGVHGDEQASPFNLYLFAKKLCDGYLADTNFFKLRSVFDFYIVPCVNGYGMIHETRTNANHININRNFPIHSWSKTASGDNYSGETAGSEFETQLVMALINSIKPDMFIDHHNYTYNMNTQFYVDVYNQKQLKLVYQSLADLSYVCKKNYPSYFGNSFDFVKSNGGCPGSMGEIFGSASRWAFEQLIPFSATVEIGDCITYLNGTHANARQDYYGADTFKIAEYTLRNQILHYGQWVLNNA